MATDYISREAAKEIHCDTCEWWGCCNHSDDNCEERRMFNNIPAADVVEVVRCKDCVNNCGEGFVGGTIACGLSNLFTVGKDPMDFCSYGRRRPDNG